MILKVRFCICQFVACGCLCPGSNGSWWYGEYVKCTILSVACWTFVWRCHAHGRHSRL